MPPLSAHHWSASPRSTCGQPSTSNISAHSVFLRHGCHSMVWNDWLPCGLLGYRFCCPSRRKETCPGLWVAPGSETLLSTYQWLRKKTCMHSPRNMVQLRTLSKYRAWSSGDTPLRGVKHQNATICATKKRCSKALESLLPCCIPYLSARQCSE
jgi:hypothetical protein